MADDCIGIEGLEIEAIVGTEERERRFPQPVVVDLIMIGDAAGAAATDSLDDAVNYKRVAEGLAAEAASCAPQLLETLAERFAGYILGNFPVEAVDLTLRKPRALPNASGAFVGIRRSKA